MILKQSWKHKIIEFGCFLIKIVMFGMEIFVDFDEFILFLFPKGYAYPKTDFFDENLTGLKSLICVSRAFEKKRQNKFHKINKNRHTKHHNVDKKMLKIYDFEPKLETQNHRI